MTKTGPDKRRRRGYWLIPGLLFCLGLVLGAAAIYQFGGPDTRTIDFPDQHIPTLMLHALGNEGAYQHDIGNWQLLSSQSTGNDSLVLKYKQTYVASIRTAPDHRIESIVVNHPLYNSILLILEKLNDRQTIGKLTTDILTGDGSKSGFVIDENMDGQPDLRFEYAGPYLYVWLDESWHRVLRSSPREAGAGFKHTVLYRQQMHEIDLGTFPYKLTILETRVDRR